MSERTMAPLRPRRRLMLALLFAASSPLLARSTNAIMFDRGPGTMWGASSNYGEDHGVAW